LPPAQRRLHQFQLKDLRVAPVTDHVDPRVQQLADVHAEVDGSGRQRGMADVPYLEVGVGRGKGLLGVCPGLVENRCPSRRRQDRTLGECVRLPAERNDIERAMQLSLRWAERSKRAFETAPPGTMLFGIAQGGDVPALRQASARGLVDIGFHGYAIGGLAVGEPQSVMLAMIEETAPALPQDRPRYLMGVGTPEDILEAVARGIDMFDCVMPTRNGRHGMAFTRFGQINLRNARHADDSRPLDEESAWPAARSYSRAYLHHLVRSGETLGAMLLSEINIAYYQQLMHDMRAAIANGTFEDFKSQTRANWARGDIAPR